MTFPLSKKLLVTGIAFLLVSLAVTGAALWNSRSVEASMTIANQVVQLRASVLRLVHAVESGSSRADAIAQRVSSRLAVLQDVSTASSSLLPRDSALKQQVVQIGGDWAQIQPLLAQKSENRINILRSLEVMDNQLEALGQALIQRAVTQGTVQRGYLIQLVALAVIATVVFVLLGRVLVLKPLERMRNAFAALGSGDLSVRLQDGARDEFGQLADGFNQMAGTLQGAREHLEEQVRAQTDSIQEQNQRLSALYAVSALSAQASDLQALTDGFMQQIRHAVQCDGVALCWHGTESDDSFLMASDGLPPDVLEGFEQAHAAGHEWSSGTQMFPAAIEVQAKLQQKVVGHIVLFYKAATSLPEPLSELAGVLANHLAAAVENLRVAALEREAAITAERRLIARELHDSIAQSLAFLKIQMELLRGAVASGDVAARDQVMAELETGVHECLADVRELLVHFRARTQDEDIEGALRATISKFEHQTRIPASLSMLGHGVPLPADVQIQVLHVVQEALSNVRKHAGASRVSLRVQRHPNWRFEVEDDGAGFDAGRAQGAGVSVGFEIMRERAQRVGAQLTVNSQEGKGTRLVLELAPVGNNTLPAHEPSATAA